MHIQRSRFSSKSIKKTCKEGRVLRWEEAESRWKIAATLDKVWSQVDKDAR